MTAGENSGRFEISRWLEFYSRHPMFYDPESEEARERAESLTVSQGPAGSSRKDT